jgi:AcrR family transcriptional regulator
MERGAQGERTREAIIEAAFSLFMQQGYHGTSMRQMAREAGISPAAIYNHFESKEDIFVTVLDLKAPYREVIAALDGAQGEDAEAYIQDAFQRMRASIAEQFDHMRLMFTELLEFQGKHYGVVAGAVLPRALRVVQHMREIDPRMRDLPPMLIVRAFIGLFISYSIAVSFLGDVLGFQDDPQELRAMVDILLHGVLEPASAAPVSVDRSTGAG